MSTIVTITIGPTTKYITDNFEQWLQEQIRNRRSDGAAADVHVNIEGRMNLKFVATDCPQNYSGGSSRPFSNDERRIIDLWKEHDLCEKGYPAGALISFLKKLRRLL